MVVGGVCPPDNQQVSRDGARFCRQSLQAAQLEGGQNWFCDALWFKVVVQCDRKSVTHLVKLNYSHKSKWISLKKFTTHFYKSCTTY